MKSGYALLPILSELNTKFGSHNVHGLVGRDQDFAPGASLAKALADLLTPSGSALHDVYEAFVNEFPGSMQEAIRSIIYYALNSKPPVMITWAWEASYDYQLVTWEIVEPAPQISGITLLIKSRYPDDPHPN